MARQRWEHWAQNIGRDIHTQIERLDGLGKQGWELAGVVTLPNDSPHNDDVPQVVAYFKRPIEE